MRNDAKLPLVYSCSGASSAAQMANHIAVKLDRLKVAGMSCIAGVGGDVKSLVRTAKSGRPIIALDGCPLHCAAQILKRHGLQADKHYDLSELAVKKRKHEDFDPEEAARVLRHILADPGFPGPTAPANEQHAANVIAVISPASGNATSAPPADSTSEAEDEPRECASPPCYLSEFRD
jgi:uncharacterized metal-binding protein